MSVTKKLYRGEKNRSKYDEKTLTFIANNDYVTYLKSKSLLSTMKMKNLILTRTNFNRGLPSFNALQELEEMALSFARLVLSS